MQQDWRSLSTRMLADESGSLRDAAKEMADGLRGTGKYACEDPAYIRVALGIFARLLQVLAADAEDVGASETRSNDRREGLNASTIAALLPVPGGGQACRAQPLPMLIRHARHFVWLQHQLAVGFASATADNVRTVLAARDAVLALVEEFGIELPPALEVENEP